MSAVAERFFAKVSGGDVTECWTWTGANNGCGYGRPQLNGRRVQAHRWAYEHLIGDIPAGLDLDHLCRNRACVNPWHLEPVTRKENLARGRHWQLEKTHCAQGHPYDEENTLVTPEGHRECRECIRIRKRARQKLAAKKAA